VARPLVLARRCSVRVHFLNVVHRVIVLLFRLSSLRRNSLHREGLPRQHGRINSILGGSFAYALVLKKLVVHCELLLLLLEGGSGSMPLVTNKNLLTLVVTFGDQTSLVGELIRAVAGLPQANIRI